MSKGLTTPRLLPSPEVVKMLVVAAILSFTARSGEDKVENEENVNQTNAYLLY